jgi:antitoxin (DNA-binding transcriptional repressor) of toxin-antitoxin stability system
MRQVTSREFRQKQASWFDIADQGEQVVIKRRGKRSYMLTPVCDSDIRITPELEKKIQEAQRQYRNGETISCKNAEEAIKFLESL